MEILIKSAADAIPISRTELFSEVVQRGLYGPLSDVWQQPGHLFVTTDNGNRLFTFDCKPINHQHVFESGHLDMSNIPAPFVGVFKVSQNVVQMVNRSSHVFVHSFGKDSTWTLIDDFDLHSNNSPQIISVTFLAKPGLLAWCEETQSSTGCPTSRVCVRHVGQDIGQGKRNKSSSKVVIENCPPCDVHSLSDSLLFLSTKYNKDAVSLHLSLDISARTLTLFIGSEVVTTHCYPMDVTFDLCDLLMPHLAVIVKLPPGLGDLGLCSDPTNRQVAVLSSSGTVELYQQVKDVERREVDVSSSLSTLPQIMRHHWFLRDHLLCVVCQSGVHVLDLKAGGSLQCSHTLAQTPLAVFPSQSSPFLAWVLTTQDLMAVQVMEGRGTVGARDCPEEGGLQTELLKLAQLHQTRVSSYCPSVVQELKTLRHLMQDTKLNHGYSQLAQTVRPLIDEYWNLEQLSKTLKDRKQPPSLPAQPGHKHGLAQLPSVHFDRESEHAGLVWLSQTEPSLLLDWLAQGISLHSDHVVEKEIPAWQKLLGLDGGDLLHFEFVCRLLFLLQPDRLFNFARCAESASEHSVGVSAFVRKKQTLMYYKTAVDCLPQVQASNDPKAAALATGQLLLACGTETCVEQALKLLLHQGLWAQAVRLVKEQHGDRLPTYLYITFMALAQGRVLSDYASDLFSIMPSWKCFLLFAQVATEHPELRQLQLDNTAKSVFSPQGVPLGAVKQQLTRLIYDMDTARK